MKCKCGRDAKFTMIDRENEIWGVYCENCVSCVFEIIEEKDKIKKKIDEMKKSKRVKK
ncbi:MAG: hypothetical protein QW474_02200 [Candidatus Aenigmatarchaeota archaeon]